MGRVIKGRGVIKADQLKAIATARGVLEEADRSARLIEEQAREKGHADGTARAAAIVAEAELERARRIREAEPAICALALEIAQALVGRAVREDPGIARDLCREAVERAAGARRITVRVAPADRAALEGLAWPAGAPVEVVADGTIAAGGCLVETDLGAVDARIETRTESLRTALEDVIRRRG